MKEETDALQSPSGVGAAPELDLPTARQTLAELLARPDFLDRLHLERRPGGFTRNLICGDERMSVWAIVWAPGAATPIHDHHCACCFAVLRGTIRELWFDPIDAGRAVKTAEQDRLPGFVAAMVPTGPNIHQMMNASDEEAISIHVYGYDHRTRGSSIHREYRRVEN